MQVDQRGPAAAVAHALHQLAEVSTRRCPLPRSPALAAAMPARSRYDHAVVDEAQDLHPAHWRLLCNVAPQLFLVGDAHQRIYSGRFSLSRLGIETRGRSRRLTVSYRTSREILRYSLGIVSGVSFDDLDDDTDTLQGYRSEFTGPRPLYAATPATQRSWRAWYGP
jgi:hypothetical protein